MGRPRLHGADTQAVLLTAAGKLLAEEGVQALSVRRLADEVGVTTRAVYSVFGDKAGLLRALFRQMAETMRRHHEAVLVREDPAEEIVELALAYRAAALEEANLFGLYGRPTPGLALEPEDLVLAYRSFDRVVAALVRCADAGRLGT